MYVCMDMYAHVCVCVCVCKKIYVFMYVDEEVCVYVHV